MDTDEDTRLNLVENNIPHTVEVMVTTYHPAPQYDSGYGQGHLVQYGGGYGSEYLSQPQPYGGGH